MRIVHVESCPILSSTSPAANGLKCYCAFFIDTVELPPLHGCHQNTCETAGVSVCIVDLQYKDEHFLQRFDCLTNVHEVNTTIAIACTIDDPVHVVKCCNETDCNKNLSVTLNNMPMPTPTVNPGSEGKNGGTKHYIT